MANEFEGRVTSLLKSEGWEVIRGGWPDFLCVRNEIGRPRIIGIEAKSSNDSLRANQDRVLRLLATVMDVYVIRELSSTDFGCYRILRDGSEDVRCWKEIWNA